MGPVPEIKLVRTDTTLDLSQKAEKVCFVVQGHGKFQQTTLIPIPCGSAISKTQMVISFFVLCYLFGTSYLYDGKN
jgi:hypothetical protein